jgi:hypothetical protein
MYVQLEVLFREADDSLTGVPHLVNLAHAKTVRVVDVSGENEPLQLEVVYIDGAKSRYYFGPGDMTSDEEVTRLRKLLRLLQGGQQIIEWTKVLDDESRKKGWALRHEPIE